ncbi:type I-E CRISPR-associated protein Cas5/CasD [Lactobacillus sp. PSON]|uniref:type I-E CRISPR-associated protein Cas5/CasD n=1 Tax=Lactobacillus sp. PSON TaxID=3455454 RepID=UPI00404164E0
MKTLTIKLTSPLQSYGNEANFNIRTSYPHPSKSAVIGMIAAALGYRRDDTKHIIKLNDLKYAVRIEQSGSMMQDFQTVEYNKSSSKTARKLTYRSYLQDAVFMVAVGGDDKTINSIYEALQRPKFQLYLGRRSNPPAGVLQLQTFDETPVKVLEKMDWRASEWFKNKFKEAKFKTKIFADADLLPDKRSFSEKDLIVSLNPQNREYKYRYVASEIIEINNPNITIDDKSNVTNDFDIWKFV